jgi:hypothetical protein
MVSRKKGDRRRETGDGKDKALTGKFQTRSLGVSLLCGRLGGKRIRGGLGKLDRCISGKVAL